MNANPDSIERSFSERLTDFDSKIGSKDDNASLLNDIHSALTGFISQSGGREDEIREVLQKRYNSGKLRLETYQLVRNVLDRVAIESMPTMPGAADADSDDVGFEDDAEDPFRSTTVITDSSLTGQSRQEHLQIGSVLRDRFLLQERVSGGSMGVVYKAHDRRLAEADGVDPWVAIKVLSPKLSRNAHALRALQQEAAKGRCLSHPNIVRFIDLDRDEDIFFIVMEWLEGRSLAAILDENRKMKVDLRSSLDIVRQVGLALDYAHRCGVVHADVKPANIMVTPSGEVKLFDFGIARIRQKQQEKRDDFDPGVLGALTPAYCSMQVLTGEDPVPADDVFSLACLTYRLVAGHRVFGPRNAAEAAQQGLEPHRPQGLTDPQWHALKKALAYSRVGRFRTPAEFVEALGQAEPGQAFEEPRTGTGRGAPMIVEPHERAVGRGRRWPAALAFAVPVAAALVLVSQPEWLQRMQTAGGPVVGQVREWFAPADSAEESAVDTPEAATIPEAAGTPGPSDEPGEAVAAGEQHTTGAPLREMDDGPVFTSEEAAEPEVAADSRPTALDPRIVDPSRQESPAELADQRALSAEVIADPATEASAQSEETSAGNNAPESALPQDTVGFATDLLSVSARDSAVPVDVLRLNPGSGPLYVRYVVVGGSAMEGEDFFLPGETVIAFPQGERSARLLIPLVQDSVQETDETFLLELLTDGNPSQGNIYRRIEVIIRGNDNQEFAR